MGRKIFSVRQRGKELSSSEKMDFAVEVGLFTMFFGAVLSRSIVSLFYLPNASVKAIFLNLLGEIILHTMAGILAAICFVFLFRGIVHILDRSKLKPKMKLLLSILAGIILIVISINCYYPFQESFDHGQHDFVLVMVMGYVSPFVFYSLYSNIWNAIALDEVADHHESP